MEKILISESVGFFKTKEAYGEFSNMCGGLGFWVGDTYIKHSEGLYQAMMFPDNPEFQEDIISYNSPMRAKMVMKHYRKEYPHTVRQDWHSTNVEFMRWCIWLKYIYNYDRFNELFQQTGNKTIVEISYKDSFWGAVPQGDYYYGNNQLGKLWVELRDIHNQLASGQSVHIKLLQNIPNIKLLGNPIQPIDSYFGLS